MALGNILEVVLSGLADEWDIGWIEGEIGVEKNSYFFFFFARATG